MQEEGISVILYRYTSSASVKAFSHVHHNGSKLLAANLELKRGKRMSEASTAEVEEILSLWSRSSQRECPCPSDQYRWHRVGKAGGVREWPQYGRWGNLLKTCPER